MKRNLPAVILAPILTLAAMFVAAAVLWPLAWLTLLATSVAVTLVGGLSVLLAGRAFARNQALPSLRLLNKGQDRFFIVAAGISLLLWLLCCPDVYFRDGGELAGAAVTLGVPHPTGFPVLMMLGKLFALAPVGNAFFRVNLLSGLASGLAAAFAWLLVDLSVRKSRSQPAALWPVAPLVFAGSATVWLHSTTTEAYAPAILCLAAVAYLAVRAVRDKDARFIVVAAALTGIGLGVHVTVPLFGAPLVLISSILHARGRTLSEPGRSGLRAFIPVAVAAFFAALAGACVTLYLPVSSSRDPLLNWGDPSTVSAFLDHLTGQRIRDSFGSRIGGLNIHVVIADSMTAWRTFSESMAPVIPIALFGVFFSVRRGLPAGILMIALALADFLFAVFINPMGIRDLQVLTTATWATAVLCGIGASELAGTMRRRGGVSGYVAVVGLVLGLLAFQWMSSPADRDMGNVYAPREITSILTDNAPHASVVLSGSDDLSSILLGRTAVEDVRPDMLFLVKQHLADTRYVLRRLNRYGQASGLRGELAALVSARPFESAGESVPDALARAVGMFQRLGPVYLEPSEGIADQAVIGVLTPDFPMWRVTGHPGTLDDAMQVWFEAGGFRHDTDRWGRSWLSEHVRLLGTWLAKSGQEQTAVPMLRWSTVMDPSDFRAFHNLGVLEAASGNYDLAIELLVASVSINPGYVRGWQTLSSTAGKGGRDALAGQAARKASLLNTR